MRIASRFPIAVHTLLCIDRYAREERVTSEFIAGSVNVNAVVIRQILQKLKKAGLVAVERGVGGARLLRPTSEVTLLDVYRAVESVDGTLFGMHGSPNPDCAIGRAIVPVLGQELERAQQALEDSLASVSLANLLERIEGM